MKTVFHDSQIESFIEIRQHSEFGPVFRLRLKDGRVFPHGRNMFLGVNNLDDAAKARLYDILRPGVLAVFKTDPQKGKE